MSSYVVDKYTAPAIDRSARHQEGVTIRESETDVDYDALCAALTEACTDHVVTESNRGNRLHEFWGEIEIDAESGDTLAWRVHVEADRSDADAAGREEYDV